MLDIWQNTGSTLVSLHKRSSDSEQCATERRWGQSRALKLNVENRAQLRVDLEDLDSGAQDGAW